MTRQLEIPQIPVDASSRRPFNSPPFVFGKLAQLVEQRTENPCVLGSIPRLATILGPRENGVLFVGISRV